MSSSFNEVTLFALMLVSVYKHSHFGQRKRWYAAAVDRARQDAVLTLNM